MNEAEKKLILGLETGIDGGSVAILKSEKLLCSAQGTDDISRSEDLLFLIDNLLKKNKLLKDDFGYIAISDSPGSSTGIRIGSAIAAGLGNSIGAEVIKIPVLEAQVIVSPAKNCAISALYSEKGGIYYCMFRYDGGVYLSDTEILNECDPDAFVKMLRMENKTIVMDNNLASRLSSIPHLETVLKTIETYIIGGNSAETIGLAANIKMRPIIN